MFRTEMSFERQRREMVGVWNDLVEQLKSTWEGYNSGVNPSKPQKRELQYLLARLLDFEVRDKQEIENAIRREAIEAKSDGVLLSENPYDEKLDPWAHEAWEDAWLEEVMEGI